MAETPPEVDLIECEAFPGLGFFIEGDRDKLGLYVIDKNAAAPKPEEGEDPELCMRPFIALLHLARNFGTIERPCFAKVPGLSFTKDGKLATTEELAAITALSGREPSLRERMQENANSSAAAVRGSGEYAHLQFYLQASGSDAIKLICERAGDPESHRSTILTIDRYGKIAAQRIHPRCRTYYTFPVDDDGRMLPSNSDSAFIRHPTIPHLRFSLQPSPSIGGLCLLGQHPETGTYNILTITRDGAVRRNTSVDLPGMMLNPHLQQVCDVNRKEEDDAEVKRLVSRCYLDDQRLPEEAAIYRPCPGHWRMKTLKDGRRRYFIDREYLKYNREETIGCTTFILPPAVQPPTQALSPPGQVTRDYTYRLAISDDVQGEAIFGTPVEQRWDTAAMRVAEEEANAPHWHTIQGATAPEAPSPVRRIQPNNWAEDEE